MISILIPIYNYDATELAKICSKQCSLLNINYEIICYDDFSEEKYKILNRALDAEIGISYLELSENKGRAKIRNILAKNARYDNLIFLDCDSKIYNDSFVHNYLEVIEKYQVCYGGRKYQEHPPKTVKKMLHWTYGRTRESMKLKKRLSRPFRSFQTNNFLIKRNIALQFPFEESIDGYGYEDLVFAETLKNERIPIYHIENPLIHKGIEYNEDFIEKSRIASENLAKLYLEGKISDTKLIQFHKSLKKIGFNSLLCKVTQRRIDKILKNLNSKNPNLFFFDMYKYQAFYTRLNEIEASSS